MNGELIYVADDDYGRLVALLDERRRMIKRHSLAKKKPGRKQYTLAEKLAIDLGHKAELTELNAPIDTLMRATGEEV